MITILAVVGLTAAIVVMEARRTSGTSSSSSPPPVEVASSDLVSFDLSGSNDAELVVLYLSQRGRQPRVSMSVQIGDLRRFVGYLVTAGECRGGTPRALAQATGTPDAAGFLFLTLKNMPGSARTVVWVRVANAYGRQLGGVRSPFTVTGSGVRVAPGKAACPLPPPSASQAALAVQVPDCDLSWWPAIRKRPPRSWARTFARRRSRVPPSPGGRWR